MQPEQSQPDFCDDQSEEKAKDEAGQPLAADLRLGAGRSNFTRCRLKSPVQGVRSRQGFIALH